MGIQPCIQMHSYNNFAVFSIYGGRRVFNIVRLFTSEIYFFDFLTLSKAHILGLHRHANKMIIRKPLSE